MLAALRKEKIKSILFNQKEVSVSALAAHFEVSEETIRRDLTSMESEGILVRKHGGAILADKVLGDMATNHLLQNVFVENKEKIAAVCRPFIQAKDCLFFDSSTTAYHVCKEMPDVELTVLTNSLSIINLLAQREKINLIAVGGTMLKNKDCFIGRSAINFLSLFHVDKAFLSCRSLSMTDGITEANESIAEIKQTVVERANRVFLIADYSKFGKASFTRICGFDRIHDIVTDKPLSPQWQTFAQEHGIHLWNPESPFTDDV